LLRRVARKFNGVCVKEEDPGILSESNADVVPGDIPV
jgi:hypothetical protein